MHHLLQGVLSRCGRSAAERRVGSLSASVRYIGIGSPQMEAEVTAEPSGITHGEGDQRRCSRIFPLVRLIQFQGPYGIGDGMGRGDDLDDVRPFLPTLGGCAAQLFERGGAVEVVVGDDQSGAVGVGAIPYLRKKTLRSLDLHIHVAGSPAQCRCQLFAGERFAGVGDPAGDQQVRMGGYGLLQFANRQLAQIGPQLRHRGVLQHGQTALQRLLLYTNANHRQSPPIYLKVR